MSKATVESHIICDDDGYTLTRYIEARERMYPALRISFRPVLPIERAKVFERRQAATEEQALLALSVVASKRLVSWNAVNRNGEALPITPANIALLHPLLQNRVYNIVIFATEGGDVDPEPERTRQQLADSPDWLGGDESGTVDREQKN
jgi:hypothetical protein